MSDFSSPVTILTFRDIIIFLFKHRPWGKFHSPIPDWIICLSEEYSNRWKRYWYIVRKTCSSCSISLFENRNVLRSIEMFTGIRLWNEELSKCYLLIPFISFWLHSLMDCIRMKFLLCLKNYYRIPRKVRIRSEKLKILKWPTIVTLT